MEMEENHSCGAVDRPLAKKSEKNEDAKKQDLLNISPYILALTDFIRNCNTPMSIAIQGDWGTGKTSTMNLVASELEKDPFLIIEFDTWQYSQFNLETGLSVSFLNYVIKQLDKQVNHRENIKRLKEFAYKASLEGGKAILKVAGIDADLESFINHKLDFAEEISTLRTTFADSVNEVLSAQNKRKLIIFIDDLDRLNPRIAVELLEVIKLFLDVDNCVFVLAIDYDVVSQGVRNKFGSDVSKEKCRSFFDKIVQLPFKMPVELYDIKNFLKSSLGFNNVGSQYLESLESIIKCSIGGNPRTIKRLINSFQLIQSVMRYDESNNVIDDSTNSEYQNCLLLSVLCMQMNFEPLYSYLVNTLEWTDVEENADNIFHINNDESQYIALLRQKLKYYADEEELQDRNLNRVKSFLTELRKLILLDDQGSKQLNNRMMEDFSEILSYSSVTSTAFSSTNSTCDYQPLTATAKGRKALGIRHKSQTSIEKKGKGMTAAAQWVLEDICSESPEAKQRMENIVANCEKAKLPMRMFANMLSDQEKSKYTFPSSSVKHIDGTTASIVTHYSANDLRSNLVKLLAYLGANLDEYELICEHKTE